MVPAFCVCDLQGMEIRKKAIGGSGIFLSSIGPVFFVTLWFVNYSRFTYEHYFMGIIPILVLPLLAALELIEKWVRKRLSFAASAVCIVLVMLLINYPGSVYLKDNVMKYTFDETERNVYQEVGDYIRRNTEEGDVIYSHRIVGNSVSDFRT